ncbi:hypothetical protein SUGI_0883830 [Cryptomeria japonica]|uniref:feruloyl CoA ortho-hydroxylase F6H1-2-like n=1 Tax=Cryptomeria japonica TaxID=3369 RepID=UPI002414CF33|nr:feruloyl CoA ortho-hydroxylase F6H1-2-like [Cryptomeria japonica]GLJ42646.1 hypothetical protein SUGI_0883830 [Cryptomeria japonica]
MSRMEFNVQLQSEAVSRSVKNLVDVGLQKVPEAYIRPENERPTASPVYSESIPVIDLHGFDDHNQSTVINAMSKACEEWGFFQVINHGVPEGVIERMVKAHHMFLEQPEEEKSKYKAEGHEKPVLYGTGFTAKGQKVLEWRDFLMFIVAGTIDAQTLQHWPPVIRDSALEFVTEVRKLAIKLLSGLSECLGIPDILQSVMGYERLLLNYHPPCPNPDMTFGLSGHSDVGLITVLLQDDVGGLQVSHNGRWVAVQPISNAFVINVGDALQVLSNGRFQSIEHRVVPNYNQARISIPLFCAPANSTIINPIPELINEHNPSKYRSFTFGDYVAYFHNRPHSGKADNLAFARLD